MNHESCVNEPLDIYVSNPWGLKRKNMKKTSLAFKKNLSILEVLEILGLPNPTETSTTEVLKLVGTDPFDKLQNSLKKIKHKLPQMDPIAATPIVRMELPDETKDWCDYYLRFAIVYLLNLLP